MTVYQIANASALQLNGLANAIDPSDSSGNNVAFMELLATLSNQQAQDHEKPKSDDMTDAIIASLVAASAQVCGTTDGNHLPVSFDAVGTALDAEQVHRGANVGLPQKQATGLNTEQVHKDVGDNLYHLIQALEQKGIDVNDLVLKLASSNDSDYDVAVRDKNVDDALSTAVVSANNVGNDLSTAIKVAERVGNSMPVVYDMEIVKGNALDIQQLMPLLESSPEDNANISALSINTDEQVFAPNDAFAKIIVPINKDGLQASYAVDKAADDNLHRLIQALGQKGIDVNDLVLKLLASSNDSDYDVAADKMAIENDIDDAVIKSSIKSKPDAQQLSDWLGDNTAGMILDKGMPVNSTTDKNMQKIDVSLKDGVNKLIDEVQRYLSVDKSPPSNGKLVFQLQPESMGRVAVEVQYIEGRLNAHIIVSTPAAYQLIDSNLAQLHQAVQRGGSDSTQLTLTLNMQQAGSNSSGWNERSQYNGNRYPIALADFKDPVYYGTEIPLGIWDESDSINQYI